MQELDEKCENRKKTPTKRLALAGILLAAALVLSLVESLIPPIIPAAPYAKVGFANIVLIVALLTLGYPYAILIMLLKCVFIAVFSGNMFSLAYSIPAGFVAYTVSALVFRIPKTGIIAVSVISGMIHNFVQNAVASIVIGKNVWLLSPYLMLIGAIAGLAGFHEEGSIGMLEVLPAYRRRGVGEALLRGAVRLALERGQYAFGQVFTDNQASLALQRKVGMSVSQERLFWLL